MDGVGRAGILHFFFRFPARRLDGMRPLGFMCGLWVETTTCEIMDGQTNPFDLFFFFFFFEQDDCSSFGTKVLLMNRVPTALL